MERWPRRFAARLIVTDLLVLAATMVGFWVFLRAVTPGLTDVVWPGNFRIPYAWALVAVGLVWLLALAATDSRDELVVGSGVAEYDRVFRGTMSAFVIVMAVSFFFRVDLARSLFVIAFPVGLLLLLGSRWLWRQWLRRQQRNGSYVHRAFVIGEKRKIQHIIGTLQNTMGTGIEVIGAVTEPAVGQVAGIDIYGPYRSLEAGVDEHRADTVIFAGADDISPKVMRRIGWNMSDRDVNWIVAPATTDVAGPRIHSRPVAGLPLVHVSFPRLDGSRRFLKRTFDIIGSGLLILLLTPVWLITAIAVKLSSPGPILYAQERVGRNGEPFPMLKFRSMVTDADAQLQALLAEQGKSEQPLFKLENDPRITKVGRVLRKFSLDELPQLFNVLRGEMSLVGPRPQREAEVAMYDDYAHRRLIVKPGMSGLWQVSGRSSLSWEDALRLDLYYIENWSFMQDVIILFRTVKAVVAPGADAH